METVTEAGERTEIKDIAEARCRLYHSLATVPMRISCLSKRLRKPPGCR
jgi:hypothetical protein